MYSRLDNRYLQYIEQKHTADAGQKLIKVISIGSSSFQQYYIKGSDLFLNVEENLFKEQNVFRERKWLNDDT